MFPTAWQPSPAGDLVRIGPDEDGGYVLSPRAAKASDLLLSMGLNHDWRFEEAFQEASGARVVCFDGSVDKLFWQLYAIKKILRAKPHKALHYFAYRRFFGRPEAQHRQQMIGYDGPGSISLDTLIAEFSDASIFLKIDIEGWEYRILDQIVRHKDRFTGIVMELHDVDLHRERIAQFLGDMQGFTNVFVTANNFGGVDADGDPLVIEISLMRDDLVDPPVASATAPGYRANDPGREILEIRYRDAA